MFGKLAKLGNRMDVAEEGSGGWAGPLFLALNPVAPINILVIVILLIVYFATWKRTLPTFDCGEKSFCPSKYKQRIFIVFLIYLLISVVMWKFLCKVLPMLPFPVGMIFSRIC